MPVGQREMDLAYAGEILQDGLAHGVESVLQGLALVIGESFQHGLPHTIPGGVERRGVFAIAPFRADDRGKNAIAGSFRVVNSSRRKPSNADCVAFRTTKPSIPAPIVFSVRVVLTDAVRFSLLAHVKV